MVEPPALELGWIDSLLRPNQLQLIAAALDDVRARLGADANPVDSRSRGKRSIRLDCNAEAALMKRIDKLAIELQHRFSTGDHDQSPVAPFAPQSLDVGGKLGGLSELATAVAVGADEIRVAEIALGARPVPLAARPQIAAGKAQEDRAAARLHALPLEGEKAFLDGVAHA